MATGGNINVWWELWRATLANELIEDVSLILTGGQVSLNHDRAISTQATINVDDVTRIEPYRDCVAIFLNQEFVDGRPPRRDQLGLYTVGAPGGTRTVERAEGTYTGNDLTAVLAANAFTDTYNLTDGTNYVEAVTDIIALTDLTRHLIVPTDRVLATPRTFSTGTTYLEACNTLLGAIGYYYLSMSPDGTLVSMPARSIAYTEPYRTITSVELKSPLISQVTDTTLANVVIVVRDNMIDDPLVAIARNDDALSPTSTVNIGMHARTESQTDLADQAAVNALADRLLAEGRTFYQTAQTMLLPDPDILQPHQTIELIGDGMLMPMSGRWWVRTASMGLTPQTSATVVEFNRVTDAIRGAIV